MLFLKNVYVHVHRIQITYSEKVMIISACQNYFKAGLLFKKYYWNLYNDHVLFLLTEKTMKPFSA